MNITLDKSYPLRFDFNALALFEEVHGQSVMHVIGTGNMGFLSNRNLIWAALVGSFADEGKQISPVDVGNLLQTEWFEKGKTFGDLTDLIASAIRESGLIATGKSKKKLKSPKPQES